MKGLLQSNCIDHNQVGNKAGYGKGTCNGKTMLLHRLTYCFNNGIEPELIDGYVIRHQCDNPRCVNPLHLELGTQSENIQDRVKRKRCNKPKGVNNPRAVLQPDDVTYIKANYRKGCSIYGAVGLGKKFGVSHQAIRSVIQGLSWVEGN